LAPKHFDQRPEQRAEAEDDDDGRDSTDSHGRVLSDNVFGTQAEDAVRRDFTVNALFYDPVAEQIWDYQNGLADIQTKTLRMIGDPAVRYREDPVRMLRAARLSAKTSFTIDPATAAPIDEMKALLGNVPQARLFDEILKVLLSGHSLVCVLQLRALGLHHGLLPLLDAAFDDDASRPFAEAALRATDNRLREDKSVNPAFVLAALLWGQVEKRMRSLTSKGLKEVPALHEAMHEALDVQRSTLAIPRRYDAIIKEIWLMQPRFLRRNGGTPFRLVDHPRWRAAYDFFWLRSTVGNADPELAQWWSDFAESDEHARQSMVTAIASASRGKPQQRGVKTPSAPVTAAPDRKDAELTSNEDDADLDEGFEGASNEPGPAKRKRRRGGRRRGSSGRGGSVGPSDSGGTSGGPPASPAA
jgi:poly(A) polymerase